ncbi:imm11 family protein [Myxococcus hansupus]|uniref:imm11 family protein n=1 Tax=Pseudomyxococcus hansupus TaxID=1297742 RepID=UPI000AF66450|nr:DUF1629 domain-containing protein [Myxococcus hansupus]
MKFYAVNTLGDFGNEDLCLLREFVDGIGMHAWKVSKGESLRSVYPADAKIFMTPDSPGIKLCSLIGNTDSMLVAAPELRATIEKHRQSDVEYLPFTLYDHRKRVHSRDYVIINPLGTFDCLDFKASQIIWDDEDPDEIIRINKRVLSREKVEQAPALFRIDRDSSNYVVNEALAAELHERKFSNVTLVELPVR